MKATFVSTVISITVSLIPAAVVASGLGFQCVLAPQSTVAIAGGFTSYASATEVAAALAATEIDVQTAADLTEALAQSNSPSKVYVATYDTGSSETPDDAADTIIAGGVIPGVFSLVSRSTADIAAMGVWHSASQDRYYRHKVFAQSSDSSLITASPISGLADCKTNFRVSYSADADPVAAGQAARLAGFNLQRDGQAGSRVKIANASPASLTSSEVSFAIANNVSVLLPADVNSATNIVEGITDYDGSKSAITTTLIYMVKRVDAAISALAIARAITGKAIPLSESGETLVAGKISGVLAELADVGHFTPGTIGEGPDAIIMENGFDVSTSRSDGNIVCAIKCIIAGEPNGFVFNIEASEAT